MKALQVALLLAAALAAAAEVGPPRCPPKYFFATGFNPTNSFDQIFDLRYYNLGKPYFVNEAHARCSKFPVYAHDLNNFGAREWVQGPAGGERAGSRRWAVRAGRTAVPSRGR